MLLAGTDAAGVKIHGRRFTHPVEASDTRMGAAMRGLPMLSEPQPDVVVVVVVVVGFRGLKPASAVSTTIKASA